MVQLRILSGKMAGDLQVVRHFPFRIGRSADNDLCLDEPGVWDTHVTLGFQKREGFTLETAPETYASVNDQVQSATRLRNGDIIVFGSAKLQFWLAPARLRGLALRELLVWIMLAGAIAAQAALLWLMIS